SISLENQFWNCLRVIERSENVAVDELIERVDTDRTRHNLSSAVRLFGLDYFRMRTSRETFARSEPTSSRTDSNF
ncbi:MAG: ribbon-helix-helix domain-containing protein, partial [Pseudolabrys sp.]